MKWKKLPRNTCRVRMKSTSGGYPNIIVGLLGTLIGEEKRVGVAIF